jgi:biotin operon repressor
MATMRVKLMTSMRLSPLAILLLEKLAKKLGLSRTAVVEMAVRRLAEAERVK